MALIQCPAEVIMFFKYEFKLLINKEKNAQVY